MENAELIGVVSALTASLAWACSTIIVKSLTARLDYVSLNTFRLWVASFLLLVFIFVSGRWLQIFETPLAPLLLVIASGVVAVAVGDTVYIKSLSLVDASKAFTIAQCSFPVLTAFVAISFLGETLNWRIVLGAGLVLSGIYFVSRKKQAPAAGRVNVDARGVMLALTAAAIWTSAAITLKIGVTQMDPIFAAGIRIPAAAVVLTLFFMMSRRRGGGSPVPLRLDARSMLMAAAAGILTYGVAAVGYVSAIQSIGAARTVLITTTSPILVLPFSILLLKERPSATNAAGIFTCVLGILFIVF
jgi:drug/metabolite transporter, DME family